MKKTDDIKIILKYLPLAAIIFLFGILIIWLSVVLLVQPAKFQWLNLSNSGQIGDTISGITAPIVGMAGVAFTFLAFFIQYKANIEQVKQFNSQNISSNKAEKRQLVLWLMEKNREIVQQFSILNEVHGVKVFHAMFQEYKEAYEVVKRQIEPKYENELIGITYLLMYNGVGPESNLLNNKLLEKHAKVKDLLDELAWRADLKEPEKSKYFKYKSHYNYKFFDGHQVRLGNYFRNLFQIYSNIEDLNLEKEDLFSKDEKYQLGKYLRTQMSTYEQIIIYLNSQSLFGKPFIDKNIIGTYRLIKNIPLPLIEFCEKNITSKFNDIDFEWIKIQNRVNP